MRLIRIKDNFVIKLVIPNKKLLLSCFYLGFIPFAPGTWGSLFSFLWSIIFSHTWFFGWFFSWVFFFVVFLVSWLMIHQFLKSSHPIEIDPSWIVIDEFLGMMLCLLLMKTFAVHWNFVSLSMAFLLFRILDIVKPFPICTIDRFLLSHQKTQALGVIFDDIMAGLMAFIMVYFIAPPVIYFS